MIPTPLTSAQLLNQLQQRITADVKDAWLFPQRRAVAGFLGGGLPVIVGWRPAWSTFPDDGANRLFYDILTECGLENAHLTNVVRAGAARASQTPLISPCMKRSSSANWKSYPVSMLLFPWDKLPTTVSQNCS